jgi:hypothetical protein
LEAVVVVATVAKRLVGGLAAPTQGNNRAAAEAESVPGLVADDYVVAHNSKRAVVPTLYHSLILIAHGSGRLSFPV